MLQKFGNFVAAQSIGKSFHHRANFCLWFQQTLVNVYIMHDGIKIYFKRSIVLLEF